MRKMKDLFISSYKEMKSVRCITLTAMFCAISIVLSGLAIMVTENMRISFTFLPNDFIFYLFGPVVGVIFGAVTDILGFIVNPKGAYFFGFTLSSILNGLIYGIILYKKPVKMGRIIIANAIQMLLVGILLNTYWLSLLNGNNYFILLTGRVIKELVMFPISTILLYMVIKGIEASGILKTMHIKTS